MSGLTEDRVVTLNFSWIEKICKNQNLRMPYQERLSEALLGFLYAIRTYRSYYTFTFHEYAEVCMVRQMAEANRIWNRLTRQDSGLSLNANLPGCHRTFGDVFFGEPAWFVQSLEFRDVIQRLEPLHQAFSNLILQGYSDEEQLEQRLHLSRAEYQYEWPRFCAAIAAHFCA